MEEGWVQIPSSLHLQGAKQIWANSEIKKDVRSAPLLRFYCRERVLIVANQFELLQMDYFRVEVVRRGAQPLS